MHAESELLNKDIKKWYKCMYDKNPPNEEP